MPNVSAVWVTAEELSGLSVDYLEFAYLHLGLVTEINADLNLAIQYIEQ
jgi:hypothetical protein